MVLGEVHMLDGSLATGNPTNRWILYCTVHTVPTHSSGTSTIQASNFIPKLLTTLQLIPPAPFNIIKNLKQKQQTRQPFNLRQSSDTIPSSIRPARFPRPANSTRIRYTACDIRVLALPRCRTGRPATVYAARECRMNATLKSLPECLLQERCALSVYTCPPPCKLLELGKWHSAVRKANHYSRFY